MLTLSDVRLFVFSCFSWCVFTEVLLVCHVVAQVNILHRAELFRESVSQDLPEVANIELNFPADDGRP